MHLFDGRVVVAQLRHRRLDCKPPVQHEAVPIQLVKPRRLFVARWDLVVELVLGVVRAALFGVN
jgi:hypothetical protein